MNRIQDKSKLLCCRACLRTDCKLYEIHENNLADTFYRVSGTPVYKDRLPQHLCVYCVKLLLKCKEFREMCLQSQETLFLALLNGEVNIECVRKMERPSKQLNLSSTEVEAINHIEICLPEHVNIKHEPNKEGDISDENTEDEDIFNDTATDVLALNKDEDRGNTGITVKRKIVIDEDYETIDSLNSETELDIKFEMVEAGIDGDDIDYSPLKKGNKRKTVQKKKKVKKKGLKKGKGVDNSDDEDIGSEPVKSKRKRKRGIRDYDRRSSDYAVQSETLSKASGMNSGKKRKIYTDIQLQNALSAIKEGMGIAEASNTYNIPKTTLHDKINKRYPEGASPGAQTVLNRDEEKRLVTWILHLSDAGFPMTKHKLISSVKDLVANLKRRNRFKNGKPGRHWYEGFVVRHPELLTRVPTTTPADITEESIRAWFGRIDTYLKKENLEEVLTDPRRIYNCDELAFYLNPKENCVIVKKGSKRVNRGTDENECLSVLMTVSADGKTQPPLVIFPYKEIPASVIQNMPPKWGIGRSDSIWMNGETFYEQMTNVFYPWLIENKIPLPVVLFMSNSSCINLLLSEFCREHKIILIASLPNSRHRFQPLDALFASLKHHWREQGRTNNPNTKLNHEDFSKALEQCIKIAALESTIINGFRTSGLYPFDPNNIDYSKLLKQVEYNDKNVASELLTTSPTLEEHSE